MSYPSLKFSPHRLPSVLLLVAAAMTACGGGSDNGHADPATGNATEKKQTAVAIEGATAADARALTEDTETGTVVSIVASGTYAGTDYKHPQMHLLIDGLVVGTTDVIGEPTMEEHTYIFTVKPTIRSGARIDVVYDNDGVENGQDRNLVVRSVNVAGQTLLPTAPGVVYDRGEVDGIDVIPGQAEMNWNGALRFTAPSIKPWPSTEFVYHDDGAFLEFAKQQLEVSSQGDAFLTWHATHKTAAGVIEGTDINVKQQDAATKAWRSTTIANVPFPAAGGGFVYNLKTLALPSGDMAVFWDVVDIPPLAPDTFNKPSRVYMSRYAAAQNQWSAPQEIPGDYAIYSAHRGWDVRPAGDGRLLMLWQAGGTVQARFYSAPDSRWSAPQDTGIPMAGDSIHSDWMTFSSFNRAGTGVVEIATQPRAPELRYFDAASQTWSAVSVAPQSEGYHRASSRHLVEKPFAVDDAGNVFTALFESSSADDPPYPLGAPSSSISPWWPYSWLRYSLGTPSRLRLSKWSAQTRQVERTQLIEASSFIGSGLSLNLHAGGGILTWARSETPYHFTMDTFLRFVQLMPDGTPKGDPQTGLKLTTPSSPEYEWDLQTRVTDDGRVSIAWSRGQCRVRQNTCAGSDLQLSTFQPERGWSVAQGLPMQIHQYSLPEGGVPFKMNASGVRAVAMPDLSVHNSFTHDSTINVRALVLDQD